MIPVYLQRGVLHSCLGDDLASAARALGQGTLPQAEQFLLHEQQQPRPFLYAGASADDLGQRLEHLLDELLGADAKDLSDCLLIIASTSLDITELESRTSAEQGFRPEHSTPLDLLAERLRQRRGFLDAFTLNTACTSAANGLLYGARLLAAGAFQRVVVLAFETPSALAMQGFGALELTSASGQYRPFHPERDGLILGECYAASLLSLQPGPAPLARLLGGYSACDTSSLTTTREDGSHIDAVMQQALRSAGRNAAEVALVKLHGTATGANDHAENNGMRRLFGEQLPALCVLKPWLGHTLGACGLSETLLLAQRLQQGTLPGLDYASEALLPLPDKPLDVATDALLLANFFGFGGNNASLVLQGCSAGVPSCE
ncbi:beta-ketoacyl synthase N-terminal-like domain-containing protein [Aquipseudomonas guryensis]|uniref:Beta-ketoacyl synthase n=1 Tax=Aquipseudomonas guryensis TaxID=2759165 RepID=A0A7W4D8Z9_9GAMM|nr:beta-ketoacyl synthase N-terminal-like domain-containing protein [Pseudomonas guryensis]MBB1518204.1 beta-ketoacyl synthase [Pseudomonas guryensis]